MINDDIDAIIARGESRTQELNSKYEGLNFDDLNNFKSDSMIQQWEGEDFRGGSGVCCPISPRHPDSDPDMHDLHLDANQLKPQPVITKQT